MIETFNELNGNKYNETIYKLKSNLKKYKYEKLKMNLMNFYKNKEYHELINYLYELENNIDENIKEEINFIKENDYFFPNLENDVDAKEWQYCVELFAFFKKHSYCNNDFMNYIDSLISKNTNNNSLKMKIESLKSIN